MTLVQGLGGMGGARAALENFREKVKRAGFPDLHLNAIVWGVQVLPTEKAVSDPQEMVKVLSFDSVGSAKRESALEEQGEPRLLTLNAWKEWTEGSYLEPDTEHQLAYLQAIGRVFGLSVP